MDDERQEPTDPTKKHGSTTPIMERLLEEVLAMREQGTRVEAKVDALGGRVDVLTDRVDVLADRVDVLTDRVDVLTDRVDVLADRTDGLTGELRDFKVEVRTAFTQTQTETRLALVNESLATAARFTDIERRLTALEEQNRAR